MTSLPLHLDTLCEIKSELLVFEWYSKKTRRAIFLDEMEQVVPWAKLCRLIEPRYPTPGNRRRSKELEQLMQIYFPQQWFPGGPSGGKGAVDSATLRGVAGIDLGSGSVTDEMMICKFRHLLGEHKSGEDSGSGEFSIASLSPS